MQDCPAIGRMGFSAQRRPFRQGRPGAAVVREGLNLRRTPDRRKPRGSTATFRAVRPLVPLKDRGRSGATDTSRCRAPANLMAMRRRLSRRLSGLATAVRTRLTTPSGCRDLPAEVELEATDKRIAMAAGFSAK